MSNFVALKPALCIGSMGFVLREWLCRGCMRASCYAGAQQHAFVLSWVSPCEQAHASAAVVNFSENCDQDLLPPYLDTLISKLLTLLQNGQRIVQVCRPMSLSEDLSTHVVREDLLTGPSTIHPPAYVIVQGGLIESLACHLHGMAQR